MILAQIIADLQAVDAETRLEVLLEYGDALPPLAPDYYALRDAGHYIVEECQSPVFLFAEVRHGLVRIHADVPVEAPIARSFTSLLVHAFDGSPPSAILSAPTDMLSALSLRGLLGMQRTKGLQAIYLHARGLVAHHQTGLGTSGA